MAVKTITITEEAYNALSGLKISGESFSNTILRVSRKKSLWEFAGAISEESAQRLEHTIKERRRMRTIAHRERVKRIVSELEGR